MDYIKEIRALVGTRPIILTGSCVLVQDEAGRILMNRRTDNGFWGLPGGVMELGESLEETARREVLEETGLRVGTMRLLDVFSGKELYYQYPHGDEVYNVTAAYVTNEYTGDMITHNAESHELHFFALDELPSNIAPPIKPIVERFCFYLVKDNIIGYNFTHTGNPDRY